MKNSIENINQLPSINEVKRILQGFALMDLILMPEWEYRYFSFNNNWDLDSNESMASMRDGEGNEFFLHFTHNGVVGKVVTEAQMDDSSIFLNNIPDCFNGFKNEVAFDVENATFYFWRNYNDIEWFSEPKKLKEYPLLGSIVNGFNGYKAWAEDYYELSIDSLTLSQVFNSLSVTSEQLSILNKNLTIEKIQEEIKEIVGDI